MAYSEVFDATFPPDTQAANQLGLDIRNTKNDIAQRMGTLSGLDASKPVLENAFAGMLYFSTDIGRVYQLTSSGGAATAPGTWTVLTPSGINLFSPTPLFVASTQFLGQNTVITQTSIYTVPAGKSGIYSFWWYLTVATIGVSSSNIVVTWNDGVTNFSNGLPTISTVGFTNSSGNFVMYVPAGQSVSYSLNFSGATGAINGYIRLSFEG